MSSREDTSRRFSKCFTRPAQRAELQFQRGCHRSSASVREDVPRAIHALTSIRSEPTVFENYVHDIFIDNVHVELSLWDTAGQEEFDRLRSLSYDDTHAIMLCFSVDSPDSLENVESKWVGEIAENCPGVRLVLVALKCDLREQQREEEEDGSAEPKRPMIDYKAGLAVAEKIKALRYLGECWRRHSRRMPRYRWGDD